MPSPQTLWTVVGMGKESAWGTATPPTKFFPIEEPRFQPAQYRHQMDTGLRGKPALDYDIIPGPGEGGVQFRGNVYVDNIGVLLMSVLGTDVKTGAVAPYTHTITAAGVPPSYTFQWQQNVNAYRFPGARLSQIQFSFRGQDGQLSYQAQGQSKIGTTTTQTGDTGTTTTGTTGTLINDTTKSWTVDQWKGWQCRFTTGTAAGQWRQITGNTATSLTVAPAFSPVPGGAGDTYVVEPWWPTNLPIAGWQGAITVGGSPPASLLEGQITLQRQLRPIHPISATQDISALHAWPLQATGRLTFEFSQATEYAYYFSATPAKNVVVVNFAQGSNGLKFTMNSCAWRVADVEVNENIYTVVAQVHGVYVPSDGGPIVCEVKNSDDQAY